MIDEVEFTVKAGDGGDGRVSFQRSKLTPKGGPDGGDGGDGGDIYIETESGLNTLRFYAGKDRFEAENGQDGGRFKKTGRRGQDKVLKVPVGTVVWRQTEQGEQLVADLDQPDQKILLARGGRGGKGNWVFRTATNQAPRFAEEGTPGEKYQLRLELKVLAQIGLVGLPNAGKSTLLSVLTRAKPGIGSYPFTTLAPNLGVMRTKNKGKDLVIADIPGLIKGASQGKGLGFKFLKHVERCQLIVYVLFPQPQDLSLKGKKLALKIFNQISKVKKELEEFNPSLLKLPNLIVVNKKDLLSQEQEKTAVKLFKQRGLSPIFISGATKENLESFKTKLINLYQASSQNQ